MLKRGGKFISRKPLQEGKKIAVIMKGPEAPRPAAAWGYPGLGRFRSRNDAEEVRILETDNTKNPFWSALHFCCCAFMPRFYAG